MNGEQTRLAEQIAYHQKAYDAGEPEISDAEFDALQEQLRTINPDHEVFDLLGKAATGKKVKHLKQMLSLGKVADVTGLKRWCKGASAPWVVQPKYDGLALSIRYEGGKLVSAATRGDGVEGDDVTHNAKLMEHIPKRIKVKYVCEVRGEVLMPLSRFEKTWKGAFVNARNLVAGTMMRKTPDARVLGDCDFIAYDLIAPSDMSLSKKAALLQEWGFDASFLITIGDTMALTTLLDVVEKSGHGKFAGHPIVYETDGLVVKVDDPDARAELGVTGHHPRWAVAFKYPGETGTTTLRSVEWEVSRTGVITPVAVMDPVFLSGVSITRATLHNFARFKELKLTEGSELTVTRRGGVIPHVESAKPGFGSVIKPVKRCPACHNDTVIDTSGVAVLKCSIGQRCSGARKGRLQHWARTVGMLGWGPAFIDQAYKAGVLLHPSHFYKLNMHAMQEIAEFGEGQTLSLLNEVARTRKMPAATFLAGLGVDSLGNTLSARIAEHFEHDVEAVLRATVEELEPIPGVGEVKARAIHLGLIALGDVVDALLAEVEIEKPESKVDGPLRGLAIVFTGALSDMDRETARALVRSLGGDAPDSLTKMTTHLVVGDLAKDNQTSKREKAARYGVKVIDEGEFALMIAKAQDG